jgi:Fe2+ transport system protein FeoA
MFGRGRGFFKRKGHCGGKDKHKCRCKGQQFPLSTAEVGSKHFVIMNPDIKTIEMGIFNGSIITVQKNEESDQNIVVGVGNSRYIIPKTIAEEIIIQ